MSFSTNLIKAGFRSATNRFSLPVLMLKLFQPPCPVRWGNHRILAPTVVRLSLVIACLHGSVDGVVFLFRHCHSQPARRAGLYLRSGSGVCFFPRAIQVLPSIPALFSNRLVQKSPATPYGSYDFVSAKTQDGRTARMLNLIDEHTRECLMIRCERRWSSARVIAALADVDGDQGRARGTFCSDNGPEFVARETSAPKCSLAATGAKTLYIEPGSPWENWLTAESFNLLNCGMSS